MLNEAIKIAHRAHSGQVRKFSGLPYIVHPMEVMTTLLQAGIEEEMTLAGAVLHDVIEDCEEKYWQQILNLDMDLYLLVLSLTKGHENFSGYRAQLIKTADIGSNTRDSTNNKYLRQKLAQLDSFDLVKKAFFYKRIRGNIQIALGEAM